MKRREKGAIDLCEEAVYLLRRAPAAVLAAYYAGALPFLLAFLFFWADMSKSPLAYEHCAPAALGLAGLYLWMQYCQAIFVRGLRSELAGTPGISWFSEAARRLGVAQLAIQPSKFLVLPLAGLTLLPSAAVYAFYHNVAALSEADSTTLGKAVAAAKKQALLWQQQNWILLGILSLLGTVVFLNIALAILILPYLIKMMLGIETVFSRSGIGAVNSTYFAVVMVLTYLTVNPLAKTVYLLRSFYGESLETGEDLRANLKASLVSRAAGVLLLLLGLCGTGYLLRAQAPAVPGDRVQDLNRAIDSVIHRPEFTWRLPRPARPPDNNPNWFVKTTEAFLDLSARAVRQVGHWIDQGLKWIGEKLRLIMPGSGGNAAPDSRRLRVLMIALLAGIAAVMVWLVWRTLRLRKQRRPAQAVAIATPVIELTREDLQADEQPLDQWLQLARDCMARQELRLALRAFYLAGLSYLAGRSLLAIDRGKSNLDYARELRRKARNKPELNAVFAENMGLFERAWYGMYDVDAGMLQTVESNLTRMKTCAE